MPRSPHRRMAGSPSASMSMACSTDRSMGSSYLLKNATPANRLAPMPDGARPCQRSAAASLHGVLMDLALRGEHGLESQQHRVFIERPGARLVMHGDSGLRKRRMPDSGTRHVRNGERMRSIGAGRQPGEKIMLASNTDNGGACRGPSPPELPRQETAANCRQPLPWLDIVPMVPNRHCPLNKKILNHCCFLNFPRDHATMVIRPRPRRKAPPTDGQGRSPQKPRRF